MSMRWGMSRPGRGSDDGWFRLGTVEFTTVVLVVALVVVSFVVWAVEGPSKPVQNALALDPNSVVSGQLWRLLTWPISLPGGLGLFGVIALAIFWYFGTEIEALLGKVRMAWFLGLLTVGLGLLWVAVVELTSLGYGTLDGIGQIEFMVLLVFIAEYPFRRFFFNIPGWVIGAVFVGISVLSYVGSRSWLLLLNLLLGLFLTAILAKSMGLLGELGWVPRIKWRRKPRQRRTKRPTGQTVVPGPWQPPEPPPVSRDQAALDALLDKISATGMDSLTDQEREQLLVLRDRLRKRS